MALILRNGGSQSPDRWLREPRNNQVVDSLQRYVCEKHGKKAGSYSYFVQQLENDFLQENLSILLEYGLPRSLVQKLTKFLPENLSEDEVLNYIIKNKLPYQNVLDKQLLPVVHIYQSYPI